MASEEYNLESKTDPLLEFNLRLKNIEDNQNILIEKIDKLGTSIEILLSRTQHIEKSSENMDEHIDFINDVYDKVKAPFHSVMNMVQQTSNPFENGLEYDLTFPG